MASDFYCDEDTTAEYQATIQDDQGIAVPVASLTSITLTLYDVLTGEIINNRESQDILNKNNVTIDSNGLLVWIMQTADNIIQTATSVVEHHRALFEFVAGGRESKHEVNIYVSNLSKVP